MAEAERIAIPRCIGCGAMREFERCEGGCREQYLELVSAADLDALESIEGAARERIEAVLPAVCVLACQQPLNGDWRPAYLAAARAAREALHEVLSEALRPQDPVEPSGVLRIGVWRCADCGAVDAPQECLGICIWRRFEWVPASVLDAAQLKADRARETERGVFSLLRRVAFATPRHDAWERSWRALNQEARALLEICAVDPDSSYPQAVG